MMTSTIPTVCIGFRTAEQKWRFCICIAVLLSLSFVRVVNAAEGSDKSAPVPPNAEPAVKDLISDSPVDKKLQELQAANEHAKAFLLLDEGSFAKAVETQRHCVSLFQKMVGNGHWRTKCEEAYLLEMECVVRFDEDQSKIYLNARKRLWRAENLLKLNNPCDEVEVALTEALDSLGELFDKDMFSMAVAWDYLGTCHMGKGNYEKAKEHLLRALQAKRIIYGVDNPEYSGTLGYIGEARIQLTELDQAEIDLREALGVERKAFGMQSPRYVDALTRLSHVLIDKGRLPEAEAMAGQAIFLVQQNYNQESIQIAANLHNLAKVQIAFEEYASAENHLQRALAIYERFLPSQHPILSKLMDRRAMVLRKLGHDEEATQVENRAKEILAQDPSSLRK